MRIEEQQARTELEHCENEKQETLVEIESVRKKIKDIEEQLRKLQYTSMLQEKRDRITERYKTAADRARKNH